MHILKKETKGPPLGGTTTNGSSANVVASALRDAFIRSPLNLTCVCGLQTHKKLKKFMRDSRLNSQGASITP